MEIALLVVLGVMTVVAVCWGSWQQQSRKLERTLNEATARTLLDMGAVRVLRFLDKAIQNGHDPSLTITALLMKHETDLPDHLVEDFAQEWDHWTYE